VDGVIIPDLPPEEASEFSSYTDEKGLDMIYLLAPTSTDERVRMVSERSRGFIYYISLTGTTGTRTELADGVCDKVALIKQVTELPVLVGFGISGPDQARDAAKVSDGVIVGSAIVKLIEQNPDPAQREKKLAKFVGSIKQALADLN
jgi:tryptophan synthase alpha chain